MQQLIQTVGIDSHYGRLLIDQPFADHLDCDPHGGGGRPLTAPRLEHVQRALFDGEFDVLDVFVMLLKPLANLDQLLVALGENAVELIDRLGRANAGNDVFALGVDQILAVELVLAGGGVPRKRHAGARSVAGVAEDHRLNVDGGAEESLNVV